MPEPRYDLYFAGSIMEGCAPADVRVKIGKMFAANEKTLQTLFSGNPVRIKSAVDQETASRYRVAFRNAGALLEIKPAESAVGTPKAGQSRTTQAWVLSPPNTGSLADCAPKIEPFEIKDDPHIGLSPPGTDMVSTRPAEPPDIDTSHMTLTPPNSGTLEDCQPQVIPTPIPDISDLKLEEPDETAQRIDDLA